jgi:hypothetical protein
MFPLWNNLLTRCTLSRNGPTQKLEEVNRVSGAFFLMDKKFFDTLG